MPVAIATSTVTDFINDNPGAAYGIAGAVVLLLVLFLMVRRRRAHEADGAGAAGSALA